MEHMKPRKVTGGLNIFSFSFFFSRTANAFKEKKSQQWERRRQVLLERLHTVWELVVAAVTGEGQETEIFSVNKFYTP